MDEIPPPLRPPRTSPYPTDEDVMRRTREAVQGKEAATSSGLPWVRRGVVE